MEKSIDCLHISVLSNNKLHCKVCSPNFYCFKFIFCISPLHNLLLPVSTNHRLPESRKNYYFSDDLFNYRPFPFSCQEKILFFLLNPNLSLANLFWKRRLDDFSRFFDQAEMPAKPDNHPKYWSRDHQSQKLDWRWWEGPVESESLR